MTSSSDTFPFGIADVVELDVYKRQVMDMDEIFYCCLYGNKEDEGIIRHLYRDREYVQ